MIIVETEIGNREKHRVRYEKDEFSGADKVFVDGKLVKERKIVFMKYQNDFEVGESEKHRVVVHFGLKEMMRLEPRFVVDGVTVPPTHTNGLPKWGWIFLSSCVMIPVATGGGALPALLGAGAGALCVQIMRKKDLTDTKKILGCTVIMAVAWAIFIGLLLSVSSAGQK